jgi:hypothetical protein
MEGHDDRDPVAQVWQFPKVKISAVEVVAVKDIGLPLKGVEEAPGGRKIKIFVTLSDLNPSFWLPQGKKQLLESYHPSDAALVRCERF